MKKLFRYTNALLLGLNLVILLSGLLLCQQVTGQQAPNTQLVVMTYNIGTPGGEKIPLSRIVAVVESMGVPDLLLLQEVHGEKEASGIAKSLGLNYYVYSNYSPAKAGDGLSIISRYPLFDPDIYYIKACGYALFSTGMVVKGQPFLVCSVHLARIRPLAFSKNKDTVDVSWKKAFQLLQTELTQETPRTRAVDELLTWLKSRNFERVIIGGDFNTVPFSTAIRKISRIYNDALWPTAGYFTGSYTKLSLPIKPRIDYIFYSPDIKCSSASIVKQGAGDHYPVRAIFELFEGKT